MTTYTAEYFEESAAAYERVRTAFDEWCALNDKIILQNWMRKNAAESQDLFKAGLMRYSPAWVAGTFPTPYLTDRGQEVIGVVPPEVCEKFDSDTLRYVGLDSEFLERCERSEFSEFLTYVIDEDELYSRVQEHLQKSPAERREDYKEEYRAKHGHEAPPTDDERPFKYRSYVYGPFCDSLDAETIDMAHREHSFCHWCGTFLVERPKFKVGTRSLCFKCGRLAQRRLEPVAKKLNDIRREKDYAQKAAFAMWRHRFARHKESKGLFTSLVELIHGDKEAYIQRFLQANPKPELEDFNEVLPSFTVIVDKDSKAVTKEEILERDEYLCQLCGIDEALTGRSKHKIYFVLPRSRGGKHTAANLLTLCSACYSHQVSLGYKSKHRETFADCIEPTVEWEYEVLPDILASSDEELMAKADLFEGEHVVYTRYAKGKV